MDYNSLGHKESITLFGGLADISPVELPFPEPPSRNKIINLRRPQEEQRFERTVLPKQFYLLPKADQEKFIYQEWDRRINGYWFMNNGVLTYMTGTHYFYVNWWHCKWGRPIFCQPEWEYFLHWDFRLYDKTSLGICEMSSRQNTKSSRAGVIVYELTSRHKNFWAGIQSKNDDDAGSFFQTKIVYGWRNLPDFFKPLSSNSSDPKGEIIFSEPSYRGRDAYKKSMSDELSSRIDYRSAVDGAYDGSTLNMYVGDEEGKADEEVDVKERWEIVRQAMYDKQNNRIRGKSIHTTTVEKMDKKGGRQWRKLWNASALVDNDGKSQLNALGQTPSGLHQHFTPAYMWGNYDKFGYPDIEKNKNEIEIERKTRKGESLASIKRKRPMTIRECFTVSGKECHFNTDILDTRLEIYVFGNSDVQTGYFRWKEGKQDSVVEWIPTDNGRFKISHFPDIQIRNNYRLEGSLRVPNNTHLYCAGADPFKLDIVKDAYKSDFGFAMKRKRDFSVDDPKVPPYEIIDGKVKINHITDRTCLTYRYRPTTLDEACEDVLMACVFFGSEVFSEMNIDYLDRYMRRRGYGGYLFYRMNEATQKYEKSAGQSTTIAVKTDIYTAVHDHIERNGMREVHDDWLRECRDIDNDMTEYDLFVARGYAELADRRIVDFEKEAGRDVEDIFPTYNTA